MRLFAVKTRLFEVGDNVIDVVLDSLKNQSLKLQDNDVLAVASKVVSFSEGRIVKLSDVKPSQEANRLAEEYCLRAEFAELILREAERVYGGVEKAILTFKSGVMTPNAGIDNKNTPGDWVVLWPTNPAQSAKKMREKVKQLTGKRVGIVIVDSGLVPLRKGTVGLALAVAGFKPVRNDIGSEDLFGKRIMITRHAVADDLASATHLLMGEARERVPAVLVRGAPLDFDDSEHGADAMMMPFEQCIFMNIIDRPFKPKAKD